GARGYLLTGRADVRRLQALGALGDVELDLLALRQRPEAVRHDRGVVHEQIRPPLTHDETESFCVVEPLYLAGSHVRPPAAFPFLAPGTAGSKRGAKNRAPSAPVKRHGPPAAQPPLAGGSSRPVTQFFGGACPGATAGSIVDRGSDDDTNGG